MFLLLWCALGIAQAEPDPVLEKLGQAVERREAGDLLGSAEAMDDALQLAETNGTIGLAQQAQLWMAQCGVLQALSQTTRALEACDAALSRSEALDPPIPWLTGQVLSVRASALNTSGQHVEAREHLARALPLLATSTIYDPQVVQARLLAATLAHAEGEVDAAMAHVDAAEAYVRSFPEQSANEAWMVKRARANVLVVASRLPEATALHAEALAEAERTLGPNHLQTALQRADYALALQYQGRWDEASVAFERALNALTTILQPDDPEIAGIRAEWTVSLLNTHRLAEARQQAALAVAALADSPDIDSHAVVLARAGDVYSSLGESLAARDALEEALQLMEQVRDPHSPRVATTRALLAGIYAALGDDARASELFEVAVADLEARHGPDHPEVAVFLARQATLWSDDDRAIAGLREALARLERSVGAEHVSVVPVRLNLARRLIRAERLDEATEVVSRQLAHTEAAFHPDHAAVQNARFLHLVLESLRGDPASVLDELEAVLATWRTTHDGASWDMTMRVARIAHRAGQSERAAYLAREALDEVVAGRSAFLVATSERERVRYLQGSREVLDTWLALDQQAPASLAWEQVMHAKGLVGRSLAAQNTMLREQASPEVRALFERLTDLRSRVAALGREPDEAIRASVLATEKDRVERELYEHVDPGLVEVPDASVLCARLPLGSVLVDFYRTAVPVADLGVWGHRDAYVAFVVEADTCRVTRVELGEAEPIDASIHRWRRAMAPTTAPDRLDELGRALRAQVFDPLLPAIGASHQLIVVPDSTVATVSFAGLPSKTGAHFLLERFHISYADSAANLRRDRTPSEANRALVVGGVRYPNDDRRSPCHPGTLEPLPGTATEAAAVTEALTRAGLVVTPLTDAAATQAQVAALAPEARILHLATHGWSASARCRSALRTDGEETLGYHPMALSGLALADGVWTAEEVAGLDLFGVELAVLSACGTGLGEDQPGEGVLGLRRAFTIAGARSQITTLWAIPDDTTQALMAEMYAGLGRGQPHWSRLLRKAQLKRLRAARQTGDPQVWTWAGLVLTDG